MKKKVRFSSSLCTCKMKVDTHIFVSVYFHYIGPAAFQLPAVFNEYQCVRKSMRRNRRVITQVPTLTSLILPVKALIIT